MINAPWDAGPIGLPSAIAHGDLLGRAQALVVEIDKQLTQQLNAILHHESFQQLEGSWRGLSYLVTHTETAPDDLRIRLCSVSKIELFTDCRRSGSRDNSWLFNIIYTREYGMLGGEPYGCLLADYYFDATAMDTELLVDLAGIAAECHAPLIAGAAPGLIGASSWDTDEITTRLREQPNGPDLAPWWRSLRESPNSRYVALAVPRLRARPAYIARLDPALAFAFHETATSSVDYTWTNPAYAIGVNLTRSFTEYGWTSAIEGAETGGAVEKLYETTGSTIEEPRVSPLEVDLTDAHFTRLARAGMVPLLPHKAENDAVCFVAPTLHKPISYKESDATVNAQFGARLPYVMAAARFAHYLLVIERDRLGAFMERQEIEQRLSNWLQRYVLADWAQASEAQRMKRPLAEATLEVLEATRRTTERYPIILSIRPHFGLRTPATLILNVNPSRLWS